MDCSRDARGDSLPPANGVGGHALPPSSPLPDCGGWRGSRFWALGDDSSDEEEDSPVGAAPDLATKVSSPRSRVIRPCPPSLLDFVEKAWSECAPRAARASRRRRTAFAPGGRGSRSSLRGVLPPRLPSPPSPPCVAGPLPIAPPPLAPWPAVRLAFPALPPPEQPTESPAAPASPSPRSPPRSAPAPLVVGRELPSGGRPGPSPPRSAEPVPSLPSPTRPVGPPAGSVPRPTSPVRPVRSHGSLFKWRWIRKGTLDTSLGFPASHNDMRRFLRSSRSRASPFSFTSSRAHPPRLSPSCTPMDRSRQDSRSLGKRPMEDSCEDEGR